MSEHLPRRTSTGIVVIDLAEVELCGAHGTLSASVGSTGQHLAQCPLDRSRPPRAAVAEVLDTALGSARLFHAGEWLPVAFYNPATARIALGPTPDGCVLWAGGPITLAPGGEVAQWCARTGELTVAGHTARIEEPDPGLLASAVHRHEAWHHQRA